jgi:hypothetical protein
MIAVGVTTVFAAAFLGLMWYVLRKKVEVQHK